MDKTQRIELISTLVFSIRDSVRRYAATEAEHHTVLPGYNIEMADGRTSIIRRCRVAREELLRIIKELEGYTDGTG